MLKFFPHQLRSAISGSFFIRSFHILPVWRQSVVYKLYTFLGMTVKGQGHIWLVNSPWDLDKGTTCYKFWGHRLKVKVRKRQPRKISCTLFFLLQHVQWISVKLSWYIGSTSSIFMILLMDFQVRMPAVHQYVTYDLAFWPWQWTLLLCEGKCFTNTSEISELAIFHQIIWYKTCYFNYYILVVQTQLLS